MDVQSQQYPKLCLNLLYNIFSKFKYFEDYEEFEFYLISVLYKGLIKGYIHQEKKELVFSKKNPFPEYKNVLEDNSNRIFWFSNYKIIISDFWLSIISSVLLNLKYKL